MNRFTFLKAYFSPFIRPKLKLYVGKIAYGTPYFFPRKWVKATPERANKAVQDYIKREEGYNKMNPKYARIIRPYNEVFLQKMNCTYPVTKKIGLDFVGLGWKTKWSSTDYRHEWNPMWSFVFFKWQICLFFVVPHDYHYWTSWLFYELNTDKKQSQQKRIQHCIKEFPQIWKRYSHEKEVTTNYYDLILKQK